MAGWFDFHHNRLPWAQNLIAGEFAIFVSWCGVVGCGAIVNFESYNGKISQSQDEDGLKA